jgi:hypothetical protein
LRELVPAETADARPDPDAVAVVAATTMAAGFTPRRAPSI